MNTPQELSEEDKRRIEESTAVLKALGAWPVKEPTQVEFVTCDASLDGVMDFYVQNFQIPKGKKLADHRWFWNQSIDKVMFELAIINEP